ncbi:MAG: antirestriction protein ArdA [Oscillospiraceae bacterium]|nr:antirestriction protein ArdA [Oscillospiraceae bacterium]
MKLDDDNKFREVEALWEAGYSIDRAIHFREDKNFHFYSNDCIKEFLDEIGEYKDEEYELNLIDLAKYLILNYKIFGEINYELEKYIDFEKFADNPVFRARCTKVTKGFIYFD